MREEIIVLHDVEKKMLHFTGKLSGVASEAWYPIKPGGLFRSIEFYLMMSGLGKNVVRTERLRVCGHFEDHKVTFNN